MVKLTEAGLTAAAEVAVPDAAVDAVDDDGAGVIGRAAGLVLEHAWAGKATAASAIAGEAGAEAVGAAGVADDVSARVCTWSRCMEVAAEAAPLALAVASAPAQAVDRPFAVEELGAGGKATGAATIAEGIMRGATAGGWGGVLAEALGAAAGAATGSGAGSGRAV